MTRLVHLGGRLGLEAKAITAIVGGSTNRAPPNREALIPSPDPPRMERPLTVARWANGDGSCPSHCRRGHAGHRVTCGEVECDGIALDVLANRYPEVERPTSRPTRC